MLRGMRLPKMAAIIMTSPMESLRATIFELADCGFFGLPVKISLEGGKKKSIFPRSWAHLTTVETWRESIEGY